MSTDQSVLVTGSSSGMGRSISETLARQGHTVFATMRNVAGKNARAAAELRQALPEDPQNQPLRKTLQALNPVEVSALPGEARDVDTPADLDTLHSG